MFINRYGHIANFHEIARYMIKFERLEPGGYLVKKQITYGYLVKNPKKLVGCFL